MKIDNRVRLLKALEPTTAAVKRNTQEAQAAASEKSNGAVKVASDFGGKHVAPGDTSAKVAELKAQIASGEYKPDTDAVADAFIKEVGVLRG